MKRVLILGLLAAVMAVGALGCDEVQRREWTVKASVVETAIIARSESWPADVEPLTQAQIDAFGAARVALYEAYGQQLKEAIDAMKD